ncbi:MAG: hypothetical protein ABI702_24135 [Burkholderiales bacterium]
MFNFNDIRQKFTSTLNLRPAAADMSVVRMFCVELLADVPADQREVMVERLGTLRRASDLWHLRTALFNVIARHHGESIAQERLRDLDRELLPYAGRRS